jgi:hypothetical protein
MEPKDEAPPRWPALVAMLAAGCMNLALPSWISVGPRGTLLIIVTLLAIPIQISHRRGHDRLNHFLGFLDAGILTAALLSSVYYLVAGMGSHKQDPKDLLISAAALWATNIVVFALWYWRLDAGGPNLRDSREGHPEGAFLFPQMTLTDELSKALEADKWSPEFVDYLFLAFNTSTAFSPTDVPVLSRWAKLLMMTQSMISLLIIALLVARAINTL